MFNTNLDNNVKDPRWNNLLQQTPFIFPRGVQSEKSKQCSSGSTALANYDRSVDWNAETAIAKDDALDNEAGRNKTKSIRQPGKVGSVKLGV